MLVEEANFLRPVIVTCVADTLKVTHTFNHRGKKMQRYREYTNLLGIFRGSRVVDTCGKITLELIRA